ncbi:energy-coupling factor ABC transporter ATP-binding protein [Corynebacterium doosanense]|uniref:Cobalt ABC transporter ATP-binding protein n=1 Tax=Corynebacterium doosanense CAU 212 = DSM 45436 TaxID=558173 RepID=A0A097IGS9_9CORY|nr:cobalt ABC transporter ATP-binding protein [Corynebacterium doosanense CAU 212 = DSM 45436]
MPVISLNDVSLTVDAASDARPDAVNTILGPVSLTITESRVGIIGANGSGKSTLARLFNGLATPTEGTVLVNDQDVRTSRKQVRSLVGFIFSDADNQIIMPRVRDDVLFSLRRRGLPKSERLRRADEVLARFDLTEHADDSPHTLSGGQKQMLALASVLVLDPEIIVADEPTTLLDLRNRLRIAEEFRRLEQQLIVVTHDLDLLADFDRVICLDEGQVIADGAPRDAIDTYVSRMTA